MPQNAKGTRATKPKPRKAPSPRKAVKVPKAAKAKSIGAARRAGPCELLGQALCVAIIREKTDSSKTEFCKVDPVTGCWLAQWALNGNGYGSFKSFTALQLQARAEGAVLPRNSETNFLLHHVGYAAKNGKDIKQMGSHGCHKKNCFNGSHIYDESQRDNLIRGGCPGEIRCRHGHVLAQTCNHDLLCANGLKCLTVTIVDCCHDVAGHSLANVPDAVPVADGPEFERALEDYPGAQVIPLTQPNEWSAADWEDVEEDKDRRGFEAPPGDGSDANSLDLLDWTGFSQLEHASASGSEGSPTVRLRQRVVSTPEAEPGALVVSSGSQPAPGEAALASASDGSSLAWGSCPGASPPSPKTSPRPSGQVALSRQGRQASPAAAPQALPGVLEDDLFAMGGEWVPSTALPVELGGQRMFAHLFRGVVVPSGTQPPVVVREPRGVLRSPPLIFPRPPPTMVNAGSGSPELRRRPRRAGGTRDDDGSTIRRWRTRRVIDSSDSD